MNNNYMYLSDLPWLRISYTNLMPRIDTTSSKKHIALTIGGIKKEYAKGIGAYANCEISYDISDMNIYKFKATVGIQHNTNNYNSMVNYKIKADGEIIYSIENIKLGSYIDIDVDIDMGIKELKLITEYSSTYSLGCDCVWADAKIFFNKPSNINTNYIYTISTELDNGKVISVQNKKLYLINSNKELNEMFQFIYDNRTYDFKILSLSEDSINDTNYKVIGLNESKKLVCDYEKNLTSYKWCLIEDNGLFIIVNKDNPELVIEINNYQNDKDKIEVNIGAIKDFTDSSSKNQHFYINQLDLIKKNELNIINKKSYFIKSFSENKYLSYDKDIKKVYLSDELNKTGWNLKVITQLGNLKIIDIYKENMDDMIISYNSNNEIIYYDDFDTNGKFVLENLSGSTYIIRTNKDYNKVVSAENSNLQITPISYKNNEKFILIENY